MPNPKGVLCPSVTGMTLLHLPPAPYLLSQQIIECLYIHAINDRSIVDRSSLLYIKEFLYPPPPVLQGPLVLPPEG